MKVDEYKEIQQYNHVGKSIHMKTKEYKKE
jgi:hypothetical protein